MTEKEKKRARDRIYYKKHREKLIAHRLKYGREFLKASKIKDVADERIPKDGYHKGDIQHSSPEKLISMLGNILGGEVIYAG